MSWRSGSRTGMRDSSPFSTSPSSSTPTPPSSSIRPPLRSSPSVPSSSAPLVRLADSLMVAPSPSTPRCRGAGRSSSVLLRRYRTLGKRLRGSLIL
ncbi:hypothetical protein JCGZ_01779 [Jatropha curcas]|uniref:Uncharacterized protein n=1 Tax=Jatropha curcas TaxID=180498 RepID=A0A067JJC1_JATCU|nr:hypothetical protein JCGZ_01779 [Jatropha curcas]